MSTRTEFSAYFEKVSGHLPRDWQLSIGGDPHCTDRLIRIPTGFGKTAGVVLPWLFHRVSRDDQAWPRRLVLMLPMRVLVEQTEREVRTWIRKAGGGATVHVLMGGSDSGKWHLDVERPAVLIGTQDMILSRGLNRGFGAARGRWPIDFGLLHQDALWVLDEVQLMDVGLVTSVQLAQFRLDDSPRTLRPTHTWWMSATLRPTWLRTADAASHVDSLTSGMIAIPPAERSGVLWDVQKQLVRRHDVTAPAEIADIALSHHQPGTLTLVIVNRVSDALQVYDAIESGLHEGRGRSSVRRTDAPEVELVHSRFRGAERERWNRFLARGAPVSEHGRIVVATQVVEAGVDISAKTMVTVLAPWPSLVQRFGRCARYKDESGTVVVVGAAPNDEKDAAPYDLGAVRASAELMADGAVEDAGPRSIEGLEDSLDESALEALFPYAPLHVVRRVDVDELFDTSPDLSGADLDVSRYIRSGEERDVALFWRPIEPDERGKPPAELPLRLVVPPSRRELCRAPVFEVRGWLKDRCAYMRDYRTSAWVRLWNDDLPKLHAGATILIDVAEGGYDAIRGWDARSTRPVEPVEEPRAHDPEERTAAGEDEDALSEFEWQTIGGHGREVGLEAKAIAQALGLPVRIGRLLDLAGRWHDVGKAHPVFQAAIRDDARAEVGGLALRSDLAKAPEAAWRRPPYPDRPGFRHELVSTLALLELLRRADARHEALLGPQLALLAAIGVEPIAPRAAVDPGHPLAQELLALSASELDLVAYLVCAHHGKVRCRWMSTAKDQERGEGAIHGVCEGDELPPVTVSTSTGEHEMPSLELSLAPAELGVGAAFGASWAERVSRLQEEHGPFTLAFLEALLRAADVRVSLASSAGQDFS